MKIVLLVTLLLSGVMVHAQQLFEMQPGSQSALSSFENMNGRKGAGGKTNKTAKGNAWEWVQPGETKTMLDVEGQGIIQRIWMTVNQNPKMLRSLRLQMFWDGDKKPAVDVPMGDFFVFNLGRKAAFESALFSSPEGRSFNCYIPMPFRKAAKIVLMNEGSEPAKFFYDVDFVYTKQLPANSMYFHAYWTRQRTSELGKDFEVLPTLKGKGRFIGMSVGLNTDSAYDGTWWGEGEVKMFVDGDKDYPTINGTGAEDYVGSGWGLGAFSNLYQGCPVADEKTRQFVFYRWHIPDAVWFEKDIRITLQQLGGGELKLMKQLHERKVNLKPVTVDGPKAFVRLLDMANPPSLSAADFPDGWVNLYRVDDYSAVSYFYLDTTSNALKPLSALSDRLSGIR